MKKTFKLGYIHCAGCSVALQDKLSKVPNVKSAQINFVSRIVTLEIENKNSKKTMQDVEEAIHNFDHTIEILPVDGEEEKKKSQVVGYYLLGASFLLWILGITLEYTVGKLYLYLPIYIISYLLVAYDVLYSACLNIFKGKVLDENFLMSIATIGAFVIGEYMEACAVMLFYTVGEIFQELATKSSENRIKSLAKIKSDTATIVYENGETEVVDLNKIKIGDTILVNAGEKVPLDGEIISGGANFNTAAITGESVGEYLAEGSSVLSGYIAEDASVKIKVTTDASSCTVTKIIKLVEEASASKAGAEKFISRFARIYTPVVVGLSLFMCFVMPAFFGYTLEIFKSWAYRGLSFLVVSCPCALVLSIPLTFFAGIGSAAKSGVLVKGSNYIEILAKSKTVIFDKTGTLTTGNFEVTKICSLKEMAEDEILEFIAYGESFSNHRIAKSIVAHYTKTTQKTINTAWVNGSNEIAGGGIVANIFMTDCIIGNAEFLQKNGIDVPSVDAYETIVFLACGGECQGYVCVADSLKNDAVEATADLKKMGLKTYMFTGDNQKVAEHIAATCGLDGYRAGLLPAEKLEHLADFSASGKVAFVGDGINDAPALTKADVGIAMGGLGSDIAVESADVVLMTDEPSKLVEAIKISRNTEKLVVENAVLTIGIKIASLILVSFGLGGMWLAVFADVGVSVLAVLNSMRAMKRYNKKTINNEK